MAKVLLVEDDNNLREIYEARLQAEGYEIVSARDGEEALVVAKAEKPDLIISDVMMPKISGFEMLDILRNTEGLKQVKIIMLTALSQSDDQQRADKLGADRYLVKSQVTLEDIVKVAKELLGDPAEPAKPEAAAATPPAAPAEAPVPEPPVVPEPAAAPAAAAEVQQDAESTAKEEAGMESKIEDFVQGATEEATPPVAPAAGPTPAASDEAKPPAESRSEKIIQPLDDNKKKDIQELLAAEEAKEAKSPPAKLQPPVDPGSIAL